MSGYKVAEATSATAALIPEVLYQGYGYTYSDADLYNPDTISRHISDGRDIFFLGTDDAGKARGLLALRFHFPTPSLAEVGVLVIDPELSVNAAGWLLRLLVTAMTEKAKWLARERGLRALLSTETTLHTLTQRMVEQFGFVATGILLGSVPAWAERPRSKASERAGDLTTGAGARSSLALNLRRNETLSVRPFRKGCPPYPVALPGPLAEVVAKLYGDLRLPVEFRPPVPAEGKSELAVDLDLPCGTVTIELLRVGADAIDSVLEKLLHYRDGMVELIYVAIPLSGHDVDALVARLLRFGCRFAGLIPFYRAHDALLLQYLNGVDVELSTGDFFSPTTRSLIRLELEALDRRLRPEAPAGVLNITA